MGGVRDDVTLPALTPQAARAAWLLGGTAGVAPAGLSREDEDALVALLVDWRLAAEVSAILRDGHGLSRPAVRALAVERERTRAVASRRAATLELCGRALDARGLAALLFKGEAVVRLTHGDASRRPMADIDLVARGGEVGAVAAALVEAGLERTAHDTTLHVVLVDRGGAGAAPCHVEVHADVLAPPHGVRLDLAGTFARASRAAPGLLLPARADEVVLSTLHLALHENDARKTLVTLRDLALLLDAIASGRELEQLASSARDCEAAALVDAAAARARAWAGGPAIPRLDGTRRATWRRRAALALALGDMDRGVTRVSPARWRVVGRRIGLALWWPRRRDCVRALVEVARGRGRRTEVMARLLR